MRSEIAYAWTCASCCRSNWTSVRGWWSLRNLPHLECHPTHVIISFSTSFLGSFFEQAETFSDLTLLTRSLGYLSNPSTLYIHTSHTETGLSNLPQRVAVFFNTI